MDSPTTSNLATLNTNNNNNNNNNNITINNNNTISHNHSHSSPTSSTTPIYHFKILVPAAAAGRIIGKGGTTIAQLQKDANARVKMSKASEFYPGTTERVCLISGPIEGILKINDFFMENFSSTSIKILVPNSTAGMIIGKGGSYIKQIKEVSGAYVQISQKCTDISLPERCVTIVGELDNIRKACAMILSKIVEDVGNTYHHRELRTSSLTTSSSAQPTTSPSSSHVLAQLTSSTSSTSSSNSTTTTHINSSSSGSFSSSINNNNNHLIGTSFTASTSPTLTNNNLNNNNNNNNHIHTSASTTASTTISCSHHNNNNINTATTPLTPQTAVSSDVNSAQIIESIKLVLRVSGYGEDAVSEITSAMSTLASYGVLGIGLGLL